MKRHARIMLGLVGLAIFGAGPLVALGCYGAKDPLPPCPGTPGACADYPERSAGKDGGR